MKISILRKKNYFETQENKNGNGHGKCHCKFLDRIWRLLGKWNWPKLFYFLQSQNNFFFRKIKIFIPFRFVSFRFASQIIVSHWNEQFYLPLVAMKCFFKTTKFSTKEKQTAYLSHTNCSIPPSACVASLQCITWYSIQPGGCLLTELHLATRRDYKKRSRASDGKKISKIHS